MAILNFDATNITPVSRFEPIPAGEYACTIVNSEEKSTKDGNGQYLELKLEIQSGEFSGRTLFDRLNLQNANSKAVEIAQRQLSAICHAVGILQISDSEQLHYKPLIAVVKVRPASGGYEAANEIKGYKSANAFGTSPAAAFTPPPATGFGAAGAPWMKKAA